MEDFCPNKLLEVFCARKRAVKEGDRIDCIYLRNGVAHELEENFPERDGASFFLKGVCPCQGVSWCALLEHAPGAHAVHIAQHIHLNTCLTCMQGQFGQDMYSNMRAGMNALHIAHASPGTCAWHACNATYLTHVPCNEYIAVGVSCLPRMCSLSRAT